MRDLVVRPVDVGVPADVLWDYLMDWPRQGEWIPLTRVERVDAAAFAAYYTARRNLRSEFTIAGQQRAYDEVADVLFRRCERSPSAGWWTVAHVYPRVEVFRRQGVPGARFAVWAEDGMAVASDGAGVVVAARPAGPVTLLGVVGAGPVQDQEPPGGRSHR